MAQRAGLVAALHRGHIGGVEQAGLLTLGCACASYQAFPSRDQGPRLWGVIGVLRKARSGYRGLLYLGQIEELEIGTKLIVSDRSTPRAGLPTVAGAPHLWPFSFPLRVLEGALFVLSGSACASWSSQTVCYKQEASIQSDIN